MVMASLLVDCDGQWKREKVVMRWSSRTKWILFLLRCALWLIKIKNSSSCPLLIFLSSCLSDLESKTIVRWHRVSGLYRWEGYPRGHCCLAVAVHSGRPLFFFLFLLSLFFLHIFARFLLSSHSLVLSDYREPRPSLRPSCCPFLGHGLAHTDRAYKKRYGEQVMGMGVVVAKNRDRRMEGEKVTIVKREGVG